MGSIFLHYFIYIILSNIIQNLFKLISGQSAVRVPVHAMHMRVSPNTSYVYFQSGLFSIIINKHQKKFRLNPRKFQKVVI